MSLLKETMVKNILHLFIMSGCLIAFTACSQKTIQKNGSIKNVINDRDYGRVTPLMRAVQENNMKKVRKLIKKGANVNAHTGDETVVTQKTALMMAAEKGLTEIMNLLIDAGADVNAIDGWEQPHAGKPVMRYAVDSGSLPAVQLLIDARANLNEFTECPINHAKRQQANERNLTILSCAINMQAPIAIIEALIKGGANVNKKSMIGYWTPLMVAAYRGYTQAVKQLLAAGADKKATNNHDGKRIALDYAKEQGHKDIITLLK
jgi:ankyrin repeat protein